MKISHLAINTFVLLKSRYRTGHAYDILFRIERQRFGNKRICIGSKKGRLREWARDVTSTLKMETVRFSETPTSNHDSTWLQKPEEEHHF
jgi:hypothetical protein